MSNKLSASDARTLMGTLGDDYPKKTTKQLAPIISKYMNDNDLYVEYSRSLFLRLQKGIHTIDDFDVLVYILAKILDSNRVVWKE